MNCGNMHWALCALLLFATMVAAIIVADAMLERRAERRELGY